jgi:hypothetical protein
LGKIEEKIYNQEETPMCTKITIFVAFPTQIHLQSDRPFAINYFTLFLVCLICLSRTDF